MATASIHGPRPPHITDKTSTLLPSQASYLNDEANGEGRGSVAEMRPHVRPDFVVSPDGVRLVPVCAPQLAFDLIHLIRLLFPLDAQQKAERKKMTS